MIPGHQDGLVNHANRKPTLTAAEIENRHCTGDRGDHFAAEHDVT
jgi:hypothetical protein